MSSELNTRLMPSDVKRRIAFALDRAYPRHHFSGYVRVIPQDRDGRRSAAWCASRYEIFAYPVTMNAPLEPIADVLRELGLTSIRIRTVDAVLADSARKANPVRPGVLAYLEAS